MIVSKSLARLSAVSFIIIAFCNTARAEEVLITLKDANGQVVKNTVVTVFGQDLTAMPAEAEPTIKQENKQFTPHIKIVPIGAEVNFPNLDSVQHHVYSFSEAKTFELALYDNSSKSTVVFDTGGIVEMGCNVHDWMLGYVYVTDAPVYGKTDDDGQLRLSLPLGSYSLKTWHPRLKNEDIDRVIDLSVKEPSQEVVVMLKNELLPDELKYEEDYDFDDYE
ncbi:methylamine utilization protein [Agaribacter flavus]|uniref:Methylamine utilization protein n=1 Tax=Agaribacter flavus TaxID=1902781 RepID=A0ABV7FUX9_9ALTE